MVLRSGEFGIWLGHKTRFLMNRMRKYPFPFHHMRNREKKKVVSKPERRPTVDTMSELILASWPQEPYKIHFCCLGATLSMIVCHGHLHRLIPIDITRIKTTTEWLHEEQAPPKVSVIAQSLTARKGLTSSTKYSDMNLWQQNKYQRRHTWKEDLPPFDEGRKMNPSHRFWIGILLFDLGFLRQNFTFGSF